MYLRLLPLLVMLAVPAAAGSMPQEFIGKWMGRGTCGFTIDSTGYSGSAEGEGYRCTLRSIAPVSNAHHYKATFVCEGEFGKARTNVIMMVQTIADETMLAMLETTDARDAHKIASPQYFTIYRKCR